MVKKFRAISILLLTGLTAALCLNGCTKESEQSYYIQETFKPWSIYKPGSYWIYLNEKTGAQDCTWVSAISRQMSYEGGNGSSDPVIHREYIMMDLSGKLFNAITVNGQGSDESLMEISPCVRYFDAIGFSNQMMLNPSFRHYFEVHQIYNLGVKTVYPSETIHGNTFTNVYDLRHEWLNYTGDSLVTEAHLVKNTGIVLYRTYRESKDTTWSLLRWKVIQ